MPDLSLAETVVFDADGTLLNSVELIFGAYRHLAQAHGYVAHGENVIRAEMGRPLPEIMATLFPNTPVQALLDTNSAFITANKLQSAVYEGTEDLLANLHGRGLKLAILTSGDAGIGQLLEHHGIARYFSSVVHCDRIAKRKPDPEGFELAMAECGSRADRALMVGDTTFDILTGKNAGALGTIGLTHGYGTRDSLEAAGADWVVDDLTALAELLVKR